MSQPSPKQNIFISLAEIAQAIGHGHRLELLEYLAQGQRNVEELAGLTGLTFANTSRHLQILRRAQLVSTERQGKYVLYSLNGPTEVTTLLRALGVVGERNRAEVRQVMQDYFTDQDALAPMTQLELLGLLREDRVTLLDVRPEYEFVQGHLPGALNIPLSELETCLASLPRDREVVAYCRGPYCVLSVEAVALLRAKGFRVRRLEDGFPEWKAAGRDVQLKVV
ncbi:metalloregulator ArsR/SmtB family transcription factor [Stutzerimonas nitrititolerans]|uniref:ArsR/SmtB family transcription factor n=1 Tax=Stutzerimonas nitrititolerans TaxID=2482751 RepID=UPI0028AC43B5|nr:metalloregulator ArsR/SmtB family transcription factor [Stutzerimonas nitrititolerans]